MVCLRHKYASFAVKSSSCIAAGVAFTTLVKWRFVLENGEKELTNAKLTSAPQLPTAGPDPIALRRALQRHPKKRRPVEGHGKKRDPAATKLTRWQTVLDSHARLKNQTLLDVSEQKI